jgi:hypothetical protein
VVFEQSLVVRAIGPVTGPVSKPVDTVVRTTSSVTTGMEAIKCLLVKNIYMIPSASLLII